MGIKGATSLKSIVFYDDWLRERVFYFTPKAGEKPIKQDQITVRCEADRKISRV
jgi:hypothetical protein